MSFNVLETRYCMWMFYCIREITYFSWEMRLCWVVGGGGGVESFFC